MTKFDIQSLGFRDWSIDRRICNFLGISAGTASLLGAGISGGASLIGGGKQASATQAATAAQVAEQERALQLQQAVYQQIQSNLQPFLNYGSGGIDAAKNYLMGDFSQPIDTSLPSFSFPQFTEQAPAPFVFNPTADQLKNIPGYQFQVQQATDQMKAYDASIGRTGTTLEQDIGVQANNLANVNWKDFYNAQLQQYQAGLQGYQADLSKYTTNFNTASNVYTSNINSILSDRTMNLQQKAQILSGLTQRVGTGLSASSIGTQAGIQGANTLGSTITGIGATRAAGQVAQGNIFAGTAANIGSAAQTGFSNYANQQNYNALLAAQGLGGGGNPAFNQTGGVAAGLQGIPGMSVTDQQTSWA